MPAMRGYDAGRTGLDRLERDFDTGSSADLGSEIASGIGHQARVPIWVASSRADLGSKLACRSG